MQCEGRSRYEQERSNGGRGKKKYQWHSVRGQVDASSMENFNCESKDNLKWIHPEHILMYCWVREFIRISEHLVQNVSEVGCNVYISSKEILKDKSKSQKKSESTLIIFLKIFKVSLTKNHDQVTGCLAGVPFKLPTSYKHLDFQVLHMSRFQHNSSLQCMLARWWKGAIYRTDFAKFLCISKNNLYSYIILQRLQ